MRSLESGDISNLLLAKSPKIWLIRKWRSLPRFLKLYVFLALFVIMLILFIITLTGSIPFLSSSTSLKDASSISEKIVHLKRPLLPDQRDSNERQQQAAPLPKPGGLSHVDQESGEDNHDQDPAGAAGEHDNDHPVGHRGQVVQPAADEHEKKLFNFDPEDKREISYERDLLHAAHNERQKLVIEATRHSWSAYREHAWGADHLRPLTKTKQNWFNIGLTILDSIDTLLIMGLKDEYADALDWVENTLTFDIYKDVNCFEMTIRALGGLESAFHLTKKPAFLAKAVDVGDRLIHCFDSPSKVVPFSDVNLRTKAPKSPAWSPDSSLSEVSTVQIEFRDLSRLVKERHYEETSFKTSEHIHEHVTSTGESLLPMYINPNTGAFTPSTITLGARGDSYYEYLIKQYLQTGIEWLRDDYLNAIDALKARLIKTTKGTKKLTYVAEFLRKSSTTDFSPKMDHLVCFLPGTLALGHYHYSKSSSHRGHVSDEESAWPDRFADHLQLAEDLARTCYEMYNMTATGLSPEIVYFGLDAHEEEIYVRPADTHNLLRPEYVESLFYLYHITGNEMYRDQGSKILAAFNKHSRVSSGGYTTIDDVRNVENPRPKNMMESFWLAETLKYLFLLFSDDKQLVNNILNNYIFNTEAHLIPRRL